MQQSITGLILTVFLFIHCICEFLFLLHLRSRSTEMVQTLVLALKARLLNASCFAVIQLTLISIPWSKYLWVTQQKLLAWKPNEKLKKMKKIIIKKMSVQLTKLTSGVWTSETLFFFYRTCSTSFIKVALSTLQPLPEVIPEPHTLCAGNHIQTRLQLHSWCHVCHFINVHCNRY